MRWLLILLALLALPGWAQDHIDLGGRLSLLRDGSGRMTVDDVQNSGAWKPTNGGLSLGFTADAVWLRGELADVPAGPQILELTHPFHDDVRLYTRAAGGRWQERRSGEDVAVAEREIKYRHAAFHLDQPGNGETFYLRIHSRNAVQGDVFLWHPQAFEQRMQSDALVYGAFFGIYLAVALSHFFFWHWTRVGVSGWYVAYVVQSMLHALISVGYFQILADWRSQAIDNLLSITICTLTWTATRFALLQLEVGAVFPRVDRFWRRAFDAITPLCILLAFTVSYSAGVVPMQLFSLISVQAFLVLALWLWWRGHPPARLFAIAFGILFIGSILRYLSLLGFLLPDGINVYGYQIGAVTHMILMSLAITGRYNLLKKEKEFAQAEALEAKSHLAGRLKVEVAERTSSLVREIERREVLEGELRRALEVEQCARQEQRDFVAMVSHEFRTPLAIINTSARQLSDNLDAPPERSRERCSNIREAARRMMNLMDEYLSLDRLEGDTQPLQLAPCNISDVVREVVAEWPDSPIELSDAPLMLTATCDARLLRIALRNLVANALRHSADGAVVRVIVTPADEGGVAIEVADSGSGIPAEEIPSLFQKYFRGRGARQQPGAGLGLYLVRRIADLHGGSVRVESELGRGARFVLMLPAEISAYRLFA